MLNKFANDLDAFIPEIWAQESLMVLEANSVMANLVYRNFSPEIQKFGDVVNTRRPGTFTMNRKGAVGDVVPEDATAENVPIALNQHLYESFLIQDGEESKGFKVLRDEYLVPALQSIANGLDRILLSQMYQFLGNTVGKLGTTPTRALVIDAREKLNNQLAPFQNRHLIIGSNTEADLLNIDDFVQADKLGDAGTAMREGSLGRKFGFDIWMTQHAPVIAAGNTVTLSAVNLSAGYAIGSTVLACDAFSPDPVAGEWCTVEGDMTPQFIRAYDASDNTITISPGLVYAVDNDAVITVYSCGECNETDDYVAGYQESLAISGFSVVPRIGQLISTGTTLSGRDIYGKIDAASLTALMLDRPLDRAMADDDLIGIGPAGNYNFAFHPNAIALVSRPLAMPAPGLVLSSVVNYKGLGIRVVISYDAKAQGHLVTVDLLCGVKVLDTNLGAVVLA